MTPQMAVTGSFYKCVNYVCFILRDTKTLQPLSCLEKSNNATFKNPSNPATDTVVAVVIDHPIPCARPPSASSSFLLTHVPLWPYHWGTSVGGRRLSCVS